MAFTQGPRYQQRFFKVDVDGWLLPDDAGDWACVYDESAGLLWEVKRNDGSWRDLEHTYSWYQPPLINETDAPFEFLETPAKDPGVGVADRGSCYAINCDTHSYQIAVNEEGLCGSEQWRLPEAYELGLLDHASQYYPDIDTYYFPHTVSGSYWSRTQAKALDSLAWSVDFHNGFPYIVEKRMTLHLRLVSRAPWLAE